MTRLRRLLCWLLPDAGGPMPLTRRSPAWPRIRDAHLRASPGCAVCGSRNDVEAHHVKPYHLFPERELRLDNLLSLCRPHHLLVGHLMQWTSWNELAASDADQWRERIRARP